jgi:hypothetical protein
VTVPARQRSIIVALAVLVAVLVPATPAGATEHGPLVFFDVAPGSTHATAIEWLRQRGVATGTGGQARYRPLDATTRAEAVAAMWHLAGSPTAPPPRFSDVPPDAWFAPAVGWATEQGITTGLDGGDRFGPHQQMTRAQAVSFLWRRAGSPTAPPPRFSDVPAGSWEAGAVGWADGEGVAAGYAGGDRFGPGHLVARAHTATFLWRAAGSPPVPEPQLPSFRFEVRGIDATLAERMSASWRPGCPVPLADLRYLTIRHWGFHGRPVDGEMVVHADAVGAVRQMFAWGYGARFPIERMRLVDDYGADDDRSMAANNTSGFNCRHVGGTTTWSEHAYGRAVDVNPVQNPWVSGTRVEPPAGAAHLDRTRADLGLIREGDPFIAGVDAAGWGWGGRWSSVKDYQHISATGR